MENKFGILTIGEALITMNPARTGPMRYVHTFERSVGGAELNFAIGCARLGMKSKWISRLGNDEFGQYILKFARGEGVDVSEVRLVENLPTSVYFKELKEDGSGRSFYYRSNSPFLTLNNDFPTDELFKGIHLLHISGVALAVLKNDYSYLLELVKLAKHKNILVSFDPNIRLKLWDIGEARECFNQFYPYVDIFLSGKEEINLLFGEFNKSALEQFANQNEITNLIVKNGAEDTLLFENNTWFSKNTYKVNTIDTVGAGDGFDVGYIYAYLHDFDINQRLQFANAIGALVTTVTGDNEGLPDFAEVNAFIHNVKQVER